MGFSSLFCLEFIVLFGCVMFLIKFMMFLAINSQKYSFCPFLFLFFLYESHYA